jgi:GNAT superfamily N-acetyltransferase
MAASFQIREIVASEWIDAAWALLEAHREELATHKALMALKPDRAAYEALDATGRLLTLGVFDGDELVGYSVNILAANMHYADLLVCQNDLLFLRSDHRGGRAGVALIRETEACAKARAGDGPLFMLWHAKEGTPFAGLLPRLGYGVQDIIFSRELR